MYVPIEMPISRQRGNQPAEFSKDLLAKSKDRAPSRVDTATVADARRVIDILVLAFAADPAARWMYPDPHQYLEHFPQFVRVFGGRALEHESAYCAGAFAGAALWLPPGVGPDEDALVALIERSVSEPHREEVFALFEQMAGHHPSEPHWYLPLIGVDVNRQGKGHGSALMEHALTRDDSGGLLAYLESTNPKNIPLYERYGFKRLETIQVGSSPPIFPMLRKPS